MARWLKILLWSVGGLAAAVVVLVGGGVAFFLYGPSDPIKSRLVAALEEASGRRVEIEGDLERSLFPNIVVETAAVRIFDGPAGDAERLAARAVRVEVAIWPLLSGDVEIVSARLAGPTADFVDAPGASASAETGAAEATAAADAAADVDVDIDIAAILRGAADAIEGEGLRIARLEISDGSARYRDAATGDIVTVDALEAAYAAPEGGGAVTLVASGRLGGAPARLEIDVQALGALARGEQSRVRADFAGAGVALVFEGEAALGDGAGRPLDVSGALRFELSDDLQATAWLRALLPDELRPLGAASATGQVALSPESLDVVFTGSAAFNGVETEAGLQAAAPDGWLDGAATAEVAASLRNSLAAAGFDGRLGLTPTGGLLLDGAYELRAPDVAALSAWAGDAGAPLIESAPLLESVDVSGVARLLADRAEASIDGAAVYNGETVTLSGALSGGEDWRAGGVSATELRASAAGFFTLDLDGELVLDERADSPAPFATIEGDIAFATPDVARLRAWLPAPPTAAEVGDLALDVSARVVIPEAPIAAEALAPDALVREAIDEGAVEAAPPDPWDGLSIVTSFAQIRVDGVATTFVGDVERREGVLVVRGALTGGPLDLTPFTVAATEFSAIEPVDVAAIETASTDLFALDAGNAPAAGWSPEPIDLGFVDGLELEIGFDLLGLRVGALEIGFLQGDLRAGAQRLDLEIAVVEAFGGGGRVSAGFDASVAPPSVYVAGSLQGAETRQMFEMFGVRSVAVGDVDVDLDLTAAGGSEAEIAATLAGAVEFAATNGTLFLFDFKEIAGGSAIGLLGARQLAPGVTPFDRLSSSFSIVDGVATSDDLRLDGGVVSLEGGGVIDIGGREIDYAMQLTSFGRASIFDQIIASFFPISVRGAWDAIKIGVEADAEARPTRARD